MMYMITEAQHAQIVAALNLPSLKTASMLIERDEALAMLNAMHPVNPCAWIEWDMQTNEGDPNCIEAGNVKPDLAEDGWDWQPLYTPTKD